MLAIPTEGEAFSTVAVSNSEPAHLADLSPVITIPPSTLLDEVVVVTNSVETPAPLLRTLRTGDLVAVNRASVNCRNWMSTVATVSSILKKGDRAEILSDPVRSCGLDWVKVRPTGSSSECYLVVRYLDLVEACPDTESTVLLIPAIRHVADETYRVGDLLSTKSRVNMRSDAGVEHSIVETIGTNMLVTLLAGSRTVDSGHWIQVHTRTSTGWLASRYTRRFASAEKWIEVDLTNQT